MKSNRTWVRGLMPLVLLLTWGCRLESAPDCLQGAGPEEVRVFDLPAFDKITVFEHIRLELRSGAEQRVEVRAPGNLLDEITAELEGDRLVLRDGNNCNFFRDYGQVVFTVTSPGLSEVRSFTGWPIVSQGVLDWPRLTLLSEGFVDSRSETTDGSFDLDLQADRVDIVVNGNSFFELRGRTGVLQVTVAAGNTRIDALSLEADTVEVFHRGSQDVLVDPRQRIQGVINGYGDVIAVSRPPVVDVLESFNGRLRFLNERF